MHGPNRLPHLGVLMGALLLMGACASTGTTGQTAATGPTATGAQTAARDVQASVEAERFQADRQAILAMAGTYEVSFDFTETVPLAPGYELKPPKRSGGYEVVRVLEDRGDFISLQHILVVGGEASIPVKHWRQDWQYEPERVLTFIGGNAWAWQDVTAAEAAGAWSQTVYQVDDSPRYGAVAGWRHADGISEWEPDAAWRPLPRRDMTTREDYHVIDAVNRHAITPFGWVHEQDNTKLILGETAPQALVREIGVNTYRRNESFDASVADAYWQKTRDYWAAVRSEWDRTLGDAGQIAITLKGETEDLYVPLLEIAEDLADGTRTLASATEAARALIDRHTTRDVPPLAERLRETTLLAGDF